MADMPVVPQSKTVARGSESEKITINLGFVNLGHIDLLVLEGVYADRSDFIRMAIRNEINHHSDNTHQSVAHKKVELGLRCYDCAELEAVRAKGERLDTRGLGIAVIADDVPHELASATIASIEVLGSLQASAAVKHALGEKLR